MDLSLGAEAVSVVRHKVQGPEAPLRASKASRGAVPRCARQEVRPAAADERSSRPVPPGRLEFLLEAKEFESIVNALGMLMHEMPTLRCEQDPLRMCKLGRQRPISGGRSMPSVLSFPVFGRDQLMESDQFTHEIGALASRRLYLDIIVARLAD
jgi:hypothetical protein